MISDFVERLCDVVDEILCVLKSAGVSYQVREYAARLEFLVVHLAVGCACRVQAAGARVCNVGFDSAESEVLHEFLGSLSAALHAEAYYAAGAGGHILLRGFIVLVAGQSGIVDVFDLGVLAQELCNGKSVLAVALYAYMQALKSEVENEGIHRRLDRAEISHHLRSRLGDECSADTELLSVGYSVVALVRGAQSGDCLLYTSDAADEL